MIFLYNLKLFLENLDRWRDRVLFYFIKPYWPRAITPNHLSYLRIIIAFYLFFLIFWQNNTNSWQILFLFLFGAFTDLLDGSVARGLGKETKFGASLDPLADRILVLPMVAYVLIGSHSYLFLTIIASEFINSLISGYAQIKKVFIKSNIFGKVKMLLHSIVIVAILVFFPRPPNLFFIYILWLSVIIMAISIVFKVIEVRNILNKPAQKNNENLQHSF